jgi:putative radical SAM enzyme (TIGR03279 family)
MSKTNGIKIVSATPGGLAEAANISAGDWLLEINGEAVLDQLNYQFLASQRDFTEVTVKKIDGRLLKTKLENGGDALGIELAPDEIKVCKQNCVFCFVRQMPPGFRKSLYLKDEDIRLSFLYGHFTTLSNSDDAELDRIIRERLSPIHVSVHATDPAARAGIVGNLKQGDILRKIDRLMAGGIEMHTQAVIVPGLNDGSIWERTVLDLWQRRAHQGSGIGKGTGGILSLSCVPVGLTAHRQNLPHIPEIAPEYAADWACIWKKEATRYAAEWHGEPWLLMADEWFARAGLKLPSRNFYSRSWSQIENGVGLIRRFQEHSRRFIRSEKAKGFKGLRLLLLTGASFAPYLSQTVEALNRRVKSKLKVVAVPNGAFGSSVTVAGLLCGRDLLAAANEYKSCDGKAKIDAVIVPSASLSIAAGPTGQYSLPGSLCLGNPRFLDDMTITEMQSQLKIPVVPGGENLSQALSNIGKAAIGQVSLLRHLL